MDWVKEKKKHDYLDEFERWMNLDEVMKPKAKCSGGTKDCVNLRLARNFTLVTDLDMKINGGTIYVPAYIEGRTHFGIPKYRRTWTVIVRYGTCQEQLDFADVQEVAPHTLALFLNVTGYSRIYPEFAWAASHGMCPLGVAWRAPYSKDHIQQKWEDEINIPYGSSFDMDSEDEDRMDEFKKRKKMKREEQGEDVED